MKNRFLALCALALTSSIFAQVQPISVVRGLPLGQVVTVSGVVTNGSELGAIRYLQDGTAGIAAYGGNVANINIGDSITVTGPLTEFQGLLEIGTGQASGNPTYVNHGPAVNPIQPLPVTFGAVGESLEGQLVVVNNVQFTSTGNFATGNSTVQITNGSTTLDVRINQSTNIDGTAIPTGTLSIVGIVSQFNTSYQIIPRSLSDITTYVAPQREINVLVNGTTKLSGSTLYLGTASSAEIKIENLGVGNLTINGASITGPQAGSFSTSIAASTVGPESTNTYTLSIDPQSIGTQNATLTISNDDDDESSYVLYLESGGSDGLATIPTGPATNLTFPVNKAYTITGSFDAAPGASKYLVLWSKNGPVSGVPTNGQTYLRGDIIGNAKVAFVGNSTSFIPRGVLANETLHFAIFPFNGSDGIENYLTANPLTGSIVSGGAVINNYYNGVSTTSSSFVSDLTSAVSTSTMISYYNFLNTFMNNFNVWDTVAGKSYVECRYSGHKEVFEGNFAWTPQDFSREHVYAHSWMTGNPYDEPESKPYTDQHNLFPVRYSGVNVARSNYPFGNVVTVQTQYMGAKKGLNANNRVVFEPADNVKGDVARALMYMAVRYNGLNGNWAFPNWISPIVPYGQDIDVLLTWHFQDLPDSYEIARNEYVYSVQGNRNPFVDDVNFACYIDFSNMTYRAEGCEMSVDNQLSANDVNIYPVPASNTLYVGTNGVAMDGYELTDLQGRVVVSNAHVEGSLVSINIAGLTPGTYVLKVNSKKGQLAQKVIIQ